MKVEAPYNAKRLRNFSSGFLLPILGTSFNLYQGRDPMRMFANLVQVLTLTGGRYGETLRIYPTIYVPGAYPWDEVITQSVMTTKGGSGWSFQNRELDGILAKEILVNFSKTPPSYTIELSAGSVLESLPKLARNSVDDRGALYLAFFLMSTGLASAEPWIELASKMFLRNNNKIQHDWQHRTEERISELRLRLGRLDQMEICRRESDQHARLLRLPAISWPSK